jgi:hypothetical protein
MRWDVRNFRIITTPWRSLKADAEDFRRSSESRTKSPFFKTVLNQKKLASARRNDPR